MTVATFDTHRIVKRLKEAGASDALAETVTDVVRESREVDFAQLATKQDLDALRHATRQDLDALRLATKHDLAMSAQATKQDIDALRQETKQEFALLRQEIGTLRVRGWERERRPGPPAVVLL